jgi:hypothetical protein
MKSCITSLLFLTLLFSLPVGAKKYPFKIDTSREVVISRSSKAGTKMVEVTAYGRTADKAIEQAMMDAVVSLSFWGVSGSGEMEKCPAILFEGRAAYDKNKMFFDHFFKQGTFMAYVKRVNSTYPTGRDNVKTSRGRRIQILLIVDWNGLANYYKKAGLKTVISELDNY